MAESGKALPVDGAVLTFDALPELPDERAFQFASEHYWVVAFKDGHRPAHAGDWLFSPGRPSDVPNGSMAWRRPTYQEFLDWFGWWSIEGNQPDGHLFQYRRMLDEAGEPCRCGHDERSHFDGVILGPQCRSTCGCRRYDPPLSGRSEARDG